MATVTLLEEPHCKSHMLLLPLFPTAACVHLAGQAQGGPSMPLRGVICEAEEV